MDDLEFNETLQVDHNQEEVKDQDDDCSSSQINVSNEESDKDEDEPTLNYERVGLNLTEIMKCESVCSITLHDRVSVLFSTSKSSYLLFFSSSLVSEQKQVKYSY